jgi:hypothetical protein
MRYVVAALVVAAVLPAAVLRYLPMTDLPQHAAVVSILRHLGDPAYGFEPYYTIDLGRTLYLLPYALAWALAHVVSIQTAVNLVVLLSVAAYPAGVLLFLRAQKKPAILVLLALPLLYNRSFYWGFVNLNLSLGLALCALAIVVSERRSLAGDVVLALLTVAAVLSHLYGIAFFVGYLLFWALAGERRPLVRRLPALLPAFAGLYAWTRLATTKAPAHGPYEHTPAWDKLRELPDQILGGFRDASELWLLGAFVAAIVVVSLPAFPTSWERWRRLRTHEKVAYAYAAANLILYFAAPLHTPTVKFLHFRHAAIACMLLPLAASGGLLERKPALARAVLLAIGLFAVVNPWVHLWRFDREARAFDAIRAAAPARPRVVGLPFDRDGKIMKSAPYGHFAAWIQAEKGGVVAQTFPRMFWNLPVAWKGEHFPFPANLIWNPEHFDDGHLQRYFDLVVTRGPPRLPADFPFQLVEERGAFRLFQRKR